VKRQKLKARTMPLIVNAIRRQSLLLCTLSTTIIVAIWAVFGSGARAADVTSKAAVGGPHGPACPMSVAPGPRSMSPGAEAPVHRPLRPAAGVGLRRPGPLLFQELSGVRVQTQNNVPVSAHSGAGHPVGEAASPWSLVHQSQAVAPAMESDMFSEAARAVDRCFSPD
jgi:hypothetical protein